MFLFMGPWVPNPGYFSYEFTRDDEALLASCPSGKDFQPIDQSSALKIVTPSGNAVRRELSNLRSLNDAEAHCRVFVLRDSHTPHGCSRLDAHTAYIQNEAR